MSTISLFYSNFNISVWLHSYPNKPACIARGKLFQGQQSNLWIFLITRCGPGMVLLSVFIKLSLLFFFFFFKGNSEFWIKSLRKRFRGKLSLKVLRQDKGGEQKWISALPIIMLQWLLWATWVVLLWGSQWGVGFCGYRLQFWPISG